MKNNIYKKAASFTVIFLIAFLILYLSLKDNFYETLKILHSVNAWWLLLAITLVGYFWFLKSYVYYLIVKHHVPKYRKREAFRTTLAVQFFQAVTPFATGGQPYEVYSLKKQNVKVTTASNISIQHFIIYQIALVILGALAVLINYKFKILHSNNLLGNFVTLGFIINFTVIIALFILSYAKKWNKFLMNKIIYLLSHIKLIRNPDEKITRFESYVNDFHEGADMLLEHKKTFILGILINIFALVIYYLIPLSIFFAFSVFTEVNAISAFVTTAYVMLIGSFVPIPGGSGGLEYGFSRFYGMLVSGNVVIAAMLIWRLITYYLGMIVGAIAVNIKEGEYK